MVLPAEDNTCQYSAHEQQHQQHCDKVIMSGESINIHSYIHSQDNKLLKCYSCYITADIVVVIVVVVVVIWLLLL